MMKENNPRIMADIISSMSETKSKEDVFNQLTRVDEKMFELFGQNFQQSTWSPITPRTHNETVDLGVPKQNSLTDSFLRSTLGCEEKLAKSYLQILDQTSQIEEQQRQKRIDEAKKKFASSNNFKDFFANSKPYMKMNKTIYSAQTRPVVDNQHDSYLKTQLLYLQKPAGSSKTKEKEYFDKHIDNVTQKISELGGMEDTIKNMEESLAKNEIKSFKKKQATIKKTPNNPYSSVQGKQRKDSGNMSGNSWVEKSKSIRQQFMNKFDIQ